MSSRGLRRLIPAVIFVLLMVIGFGSARYLAAFKVERGPGSLAVGVSPGVREDVERLVAAYLSADPECDVTLVESDGTHAGLLELLRSGAVDGVFAETDLLERAGLQPDAAGFHQARLLSVDFPSPHRSVSLEEARSILAELEAGRPGPWPAAGLAVIGLAERSPDRQLLSVEGVYPTLDTVLDGSYPLATEVGFVLRRPSGLAAALSRLPGVGTWLEPNRAVVRAFAEWLGTAEARAAFHGVTGEITLAAVGDVMLARKTQREIDKYGLDYPFGNVAELLSSADITFCNLEAPLGDTGTPIPGKGIWLRGRPEFVECLKLAGMDVVSVCNNHILDYDSPCMLQTLDLLTEAGMVYVGGGRDEKDARTVRVVEADGIRLAFVGYTEFADSWLFWDYDYRRTFLAGEDTPGCNPLDMTIIAEDIARAKEMADIVVVSFHWGWEDIPYPQAFNPKNDCVAIAHQVIDLGASVVLGHHPHIVQGFEVYGGGVIAYSLGNFVNDQAKVHQKEGTILELQLSPEGVLSARITPVWIESTAPRFMEGDELRQMMEKIERLSAVFGD
ncbi:MAG TPA: hypothetical protein DHW14_03195 [Clostridiales bacterium]|nr:hypothetical protein [Clostridiales bacterium]